MKELGSFQLMPFLQPRHLRCWMLLQHARLSFIIIQASLATIGLTYS